MAPDTLFGFEIHVQTIIFCVVAFLTVAWWLQKPRNFPPGPWGWPLVGYLLNLLLTLYHTGLKLHEIFTKMGTQYGPVFSMRIGGRLVIVLNKHSIIKKAFQNPKLSNRPLSSSLKEIGLELGFLSPGEGWKQQRRFALTTLRSFGVSKRSFEGCIAEEAEFLLEEITNLKDTPFDTCPLFTNATSNIICSVVFGKRYGYTDSNFKYLLTLLDQYEQLFGAGGLQLFFPIARYLQPSLHKRLMNNIFDIRKFVASIVKQHESSRDPDNPNDYIDVYLNEIETSKGSSGEEYFNSKTMYQIIIGLFGAGTETTATTLRWAVKYMMAYPEIQKKVQQELDSVVGRNRFPRLSDKMDLPFTMATLLEVQRIASIISLGLFHCCGEETTIEGYTVPEGSLVLPNLWNVHHDPETWKNPEEFKPDRFLDHDGVLQEREELIPFSTGRRICIGEHLAKMELYIFFTHMMHRFTFEKPDDNQSISFKGVTGLVNAPDTFLVKVTCRD